jgi:hypothetical protein
VTKQSRRASAEVNGTPSGWLVKTGQGYYTGNGHSSLEMWTVFPQWAKVYHRQGWAQKVAARLAGQVIPIAVSGHATTAELNALPATRNHGLSDGKQGGIN